MQSIARRSSQADRAVNLQFFSFLPAVFLCSPIFSSLPPFGFPLFIFLPSLAVNHASLFFPSCSAVAAFCAYHSSCYCGPSTTGIMITSIDGSVTGSGSFFFCSSPSDVSAAAVPRLRSPFACRSSLVPDRAFSPASAFSLPFSLAP